jgi:SulP family sulfate permease
MSYSFEFRPRLLQSLQGYNRERFLKDVGAGVTVGIVALPLAMAFAIASGLSPEAGLWTAIIAGFLISALGGSNVQIGGPAGAFIVIVYGIVERYGLANLLISTACAGVILFLLGLLRLGTLVRYVPVSIVIGFTNGIAVLIACSQLKDLLGLDVAKMPADFFAQLHTLGLHLGSFNFYAFGLGAACVCGLFLWPRLWGAQSPILGAMDLPGMRRAAKVNARVPGPIVALLTLTLAAWFFKMPVETIGSRFGSIPAGLPAFALPDFSWETVKQLVTPTVTIALLGAIESLLCARVADQLSTHPKHDPNQELMAQGIANFVTPFFGGMPATGTIARTVTNVRSGATSPVSGMVHSGVLLLVVLVAAPLALHVPLAVLAGILLFVAWNMGEWHEFARLRQFSNHYRLLMLGTFLPYRGVRSDRGGSSGAGVGLRALCAPHERVVQGRDRAYSTRRRRHQSALRFKLHGALFFGAVGKLDNLFAAVEQGPDTPHMVLDAEHLIALDTSGLDTLRQLHKAVLKRGGTLAFQALHEQPQSLIERSGFAAELAGSPSGVARP